MDIGPGDRVRCVDASAKLVSHTFAPKLLVVGATYSVTSCLIDPKTGRPALRLAEFDHDVLAIQAALGGSYHIGFGAWRFRKLPDISEWLETSTTYEEPRRVPAPREVEGV